MTLSADTSPAAERAQIERWRQMTPAEKLSLVSAMSRSVNALARAGILARYPAASEREVFLRFALLTLGETLARAAYPEIDELGIE